LGDKFQLKSKIHILAIVFMALLFSGFAMQTCLIKAKCSQATNMSIEELENYYSGSLVKGRTASRPNLRLTPAILGVGLSNLYFGMSQFSFHDLENSPLFSTDPWGTRRLGNKKTLTQMTVIPTMLTFPIIALSPLLILILIWFRPTWQRIVIITASASIMLGWYPTILTVFFDFMELFIDWPRFYFIFDTHMQPYDFIAIGVTALMLGYISRCDIKRWWEILIITLIGQFTFEYFGMVFGVALAIDVFLKSSELNIVDRLKSTAKPLLFVGIVSVCIAAFTSVIFYYVLGNFVADNCHLGSCLDTNLYNVTSFKIIVSAAITFLYPSTLIGSVLGVVFALLSRKSTEGSYLKGDLNASFGMWIGLALAAIIGIFTVPYPTELGRQFLPISTVTLLMCLQFTRLTVINYLNSRQRPAI
jgi:hypothetical protein